MPSALLIDWYKANDRKIRIKVFKWLKNNRGYNGTISKESLMFECAWSVDNCGTLSNAAELNEKLQKAVVRPQFKKYFDKVFDSVEKAYNDKILK